MKNKNIYSHVRRTFLTCGSISHVRKPCGILPTMIASVTQDERHHTCFPIVPIVVQNTPKCHGEVH